MNNQQSSLPDWSLEQAIYIQTNSEVGSKLWNEAGYVMVAYQQRVQQAVISQIPYQP